MLVDLHIHTYYSDGTMSPKEVVEDAKRKNLGIIAITDHDVLDSYEELKVEAEKAGIIAIRGVEIDSIFEGHLVHLLAYKFEDNEKLFKLINHAKEQLLETSIELIRRMENDYEGISLEDIIHMNMKEEKVDGRESIICMIEKLQKAYLME